MKARIVRAAGSLWLAMTCGAGFLEAADAPVRVEARAVQPAGAGSHGFTLLPPSRTSIHHTNRLSDALAARNRILENGSGVAAGDVNGDGLCDLYFSQMDGPNALYLNRGDWRFEAVADAGGAACADLRSTGAVLADLDGDGDLDLLSASVGGGCRLFLNDGAGRFTDASPSSGLLPRWAAHSIAVADIDADGDLDVFVVNYRTKTLKDAEATEKIRLRRVNGRLTVPPEMQGDVELMETDGGLSLVEFGEPSVLYLNDGKARFEPVSWTGGRFVDEAGRTLTAPPRDWGLAAMFRDFTGDGAPDLYVCNDLFSPDRAWVNDGTGRFRALPGQAMRKSTWASMAVDFGDLDRDGRAEFMVVDMMSRSHRVRHVQRGNQELDDHPWWGHPLDRKAVLSRPQVMRNTLFWNEGPDGFAEVAQLSGVHATEWSWGVVFLDVDLDGFEDILVANGHAHDVNNMDAGMRQVSTSKGPPTTRLLEFARLPARNVAFRNQRNLAFSDASHAWRFDWDGVSHGMALADLDNDGDADVVLNNLNAPAGILRNDGSHPRVLARLRDLPPNTQAVGARVALACQGFPEQTQEIVSGGRYLSGDDPTRTFAALGGPMELRVTWRDGSSSVVRDVRPNTAYTLARLPADAPKAAVVPAPAPTPAARAATASPLFEEPNPSPAAAHHDSDVNDDERQPLLPRKLSQNGPGVAWADVNGDGSPDLLLPDAKGSVLQVWMANGTGGFTPVKAPALSEPAPGDQIAAIHWAIDPGRGLLALSTSGYEADTPITNSVTLFSVSAEGVEKVAALPAGPNVGALAAADLDGDDDLDLFVAGQAIPGQYPRAVPSRIFRQNNNQWTPDDANNQRLAHVGLVNGAIWTDLDGDGDPDLVLACEWGPLRVFRNTQGSLKEVTADLGLQNSAGWWNSVAAADLDGDGRMDLVAGNWGRNTKYEPFRAQGLRLHHGDLDDNGTHDAIEAYIDPDTGKEVPWRDYKAMGKALPGILEKFQTYDAYGSASLADILGDGLRKAATLSVTNTESMLFLNRGKSFEPRPLPLQAQFSPVFGIITADLDGDGHVDVFLAQNFFAVDRETGRYDAGRGLLLKGDGRGGLEPMSGTTSGIRILGEQRGAAAADFDGDGRIDLAVTQNAGPLKLLRNAGARPGLRVRLIGRPGNASAVGAQLRLAFGPSLGPVHEIRAGGGYASQDAHVLVLPTPSAPSRLWVRWPGGEAREHPLPKDAREVEADVQGALRVVR